MYLPYFCTSKNGKGAEKACLFRVDSVAQLVEHNTFNVRVLGSSPSGITAAAFKPLFLCPKCTVLLQRHRFQAQF